MAVLQLQLYVVVQGLHIIHFTSNSGKCIIVTKIAAIDRIVMFIVLGIAPLVMFIVVTPSCTWC